MFNKISGKIKFFVFFLAVLSISTNLFAEAETHDGFFFRGILGVGSGKTNIKDLDGDDCKMSGAYSNAMLQFGWSITNNLIVFADIEQFLIQEPDTDWGSESGTMKDTNLDVLGLGAGICYYIMPINMYLSASILTCQTTLDFAGIDSHSESGLGTTVMIGKEWWVSKDWGLGVAGVFHYSKMEWDTIEGKRDVENKYIGIAFSATYN